MNSVEDIDDNYDDFDPDPPSAEDQHQFEMAREFMFLLYAYRDGFRPCSFLGNAIKIVLHQWRSGAIDLGTRRRMLQAVLDAEHLKETRLPEQLDPSMSQYGFRALCSLVSLWNEPMDTKDEYPADYINVMETWARSFMDVLLDFSVPEREYDNALQTLCINSRQTFHKAYKTKLMNEKF